MKSDTVHTYIDQIRAKHSGEEMIILESQMPGHPSSEFSYVAVRPLQMICASGDQIYCLVDGTEDSFKGNPWEALKKFRKRTNGWLFGYLGYDLKNYTEDLRSENRSLADLPDLIFFEPEFLYRITPARIEVWSSESVFEPLSPDDLPMGTEMVQESNEKLTGIKPSPLLERHEYERAVLDIQRRIGEGDFYELNYSYPLKGEYNGDPYDLYKKMREINPVPFGVFMKLKDFSSCCVSPERFLKKKGKKVTSEPIKGTAARSTIPDLDQVRRNELLNEKNRAENLMIVDLVRHDLAKIAIGGTVRVSKLFDIQSFGTVHQLISTVEANVDENVDPIDIIKSCFPMGSMTGAPKIEVMKVIDELENYRRGLYSGSIGYLDPNGDFDLNVVIRTAIVQNSTMIYPVGGAITSDSVTGQEWIETEIKSRSITHVFE